MTSSKPLAARAGSLIGGLMLLLLAGGAFAQAQTDSTAVPRDSATTTASAPVRHTASNGTSSPHTFRPFTAGLEYSTVTSVMPTRCMTRAAGLGCGSSSVCASSVLPEPVGPTSRILLFASSTSSFLVRFFSRL